MKASIYKKLGVERPQKLYGVSIYGFYMPSFFSKEEAQKRANKFNSALSSHVSKETEKLQAEIADLKENLNRVIDAHMGAEKEVSELKAELEKVDYAYKNIEKRYNNAVTQVDELKAEVERLKCIGHTPESEMHELSTRELIERLISSQLKVEKLEFMIEHGLGYDDMVNDITMPHEI